MVDAVGFEPTHFTNWVTASLDSPTSTSILILVETDGFEPPRFLKNRFTVCRHQPLGHASNILKHINLAMLQQLIQS
jgi:hypothetical protein